MKARVTTLDVSGAQRTADRAQTIPVPLQLTEAHVINLASRRERLEHFCGQVHGVLQWPLVLHRFDAIDTRAWATHATCDGRATFVPYVTPAALPVIAKGLRQEHRELSRGAVGCALSHAALWQRLCADEAAQMMLIFEDDASWAPRTLMSLETLTNLIRRVPDDWDLLTLGCIPRKVISAHDGCLKLKFFHQLHAYVVRRRGAQILCHNLLPLGAQIDTVVSEKVQSDGLVVYGIWPNLFEQAWQRDPRFASDCQTPLFVAPQRPY